MNTSKLTGAALYWALAKAEGHNVMRFHDLMREAARFSNYQGDLEWHLMVQPNIWCIPRGIGIQCDTIPVPTLDRLVEDYRLSVAVVDDDEPIIWSACFSDPWRRMKSRYAQTGGTALEAACRSVVLLRMGEFVTVPEDLI